jgi:hypothetical protein
LWAEIALFRARNERRVELIVTVTTSLADTEPAAHPATINLKPDVPRRARLENRKMMLTKSALLTVAIGGGFAAAHGAQAAVVPYVLTANAPAHCQAFTPGAANTIRNRVVGSENVGPTMNVACTFEVVHSPTASPVITVQLWFSNNGDSALSINCTLLPGFQGSTGVAVNKSVTVLADKLQREITFSSADTSDPLDTTLGDNLVGVNCALPTGAVINDTYVNWLDENGV